MASHPTHVRLCCAVQHTDGMLGSWAQLHICTVRPGTRKAVRNWFTVRGGPPSKRRYGYVHGLCKRRSSGLDFGKNVIPLLEGVGTNRSQIWARGGPVTAKHPQDWAVSCPATLSCQGTRRPGGMGCCRRKVCRSSCRPAASQGDRDRHAGSLVTCREARGTGHKSENPWRIDPSDVCESESQGSEVAHEAG